MSTAEAQIGVNTNLQKQDLSNLDISNLTPLSPEVISRQATINIGTIGHVAHGKSTVVKAISGVQTVRFKNELERNITIKLERISYERLLKISKSPKLLREYEAREKHRLQGLQIGRLNANNYKNHNGNLTHLDANTLFSFQRKQTYFPTVRGISTSPSSGYESLNDNASTYSVELTENARNFRKRHVLSPRTRTASIDSIAPPIHSAKLKQKRRASCEAGAGTHNSKKRKTTNTEYFVERIESLESINSLPSFFVKWLNYPAEQNTWESYATVADCVLLPPFIDQLCQLHKQTINELTLELETEIEQRELVYDTAQIDILKLDEYDPMIMQVDLLLLAQFRLSGSQNQKEPAKIRQRCIMAMLLAPYYNLRTQQQQQLKDWQHRMNAVEVFAPVKLENNVDLDVLDMDFQYIKESFPGSGVRISSCPPIGCTCVDMCAPLTKCCSRLADSYFAYKPNARLRIQPGEAIYECNSTCVCSKDCVNRVIQRGRKNTLCLFKTPNGCGWGLRTERPMFKGEYVCEYVGEIITAEEANERGKKYDAIGRTYLFDLDYNTAAESVYTIDAAMHGNISHFINHSCDPNLAVFPFWIENLDINMPRLAFFTLRQIKAGEELSFDYIRNDLDASDYENLSEAEKVTCRCGAANCRKVLF